MQARTHLESLLADGNLDETFELYTQLSRQYNDAERTEKGILENSRYNGLMEQHLHGTISQADYQLERARISRSALNLIKGIPGNWKYPYEPLPENETPLPHIPTTSPLAGTHPVPQKSFLERWGLVLGILASLAGILGITLKDVLFPKEETTTPSNPPQNSQPANTGPVSTPTTTPLRTPLTQRLSPNPPPLPRREKPNHAPPSLRGNRPHPSRKPPFRVIRNP